MKTPAMFVTAGLCGLLVVSAFGKTSEAKPAPAKEATAPVAGGVTRNDVSKPLIAGPSADAATIEEAKREHIRPGAELHAMDTPPPAPRKEVRPPPPTGGLIWVPGHWRPVKGEWTWVKGEWGFPPTPVSVWIEPRYDPATKQWSAGYWQPDREVPYEEEETSDEDPLPVVKF